MTIEHWTNDVIDYRFRISDQQIEVKLITPAQFKGADIYARKKGERGWRLIGALPPNSKLKERRIVREMVVARYAVPKLPATE